MRQYEQTKSIKVPADKVFAYIDNHSQISSHMSQSSWMMGGSRMNVEVDSGMGQRVGSHIKMGGKVFGIPLFLNEVVILYEPPYRKEWETVGEQKLIVIGSYTMGVKIEEENGFSKLKIFIKYELPKSWKTRWLGYLFSRMYAKWCVKQMMNNVIAHFETE
ncbi:MAG TPA: SRPBCC family protein [Flavobacterium sp.]|uniref:SRPBCC family protein n=1 Tax=Flavobacterium sp. TaxID=239 RepID=UPI002F40109A